MVFPLIKTAHYIGLIALLGGAPFVYVIWGPGLMPRASWRALGQSWGDRAFLQRVRVVTTAGWVAVAVTVLLDVLRMTYEFYGTGEGRFFVEQLIGTRSGRMVGLRIVSATVFWLVVTVPLAQKSSKSRAVSPAIRRHLDRRIPPPNGRLRSRVLAIGRILLGPMTLVSGGGVVVSVSTLSHQASKGTGWPLVADGVHVIATVLWAGGLLYLSLIPWSVMRREPGAGNQLARVAGRFSRLALLCVACLIVTGAYMASLHFSSLHTFTTSAYGRYLLAKLALIAGAMTVAATHFMYTVPALSSGEGRARLMAHRFLTLVRWETVIVIVVLAVVGFLTMQPPPR